MHVVLKKHLRSFPSTLFLTTSGLCFASIARVAPVGRKHLAEYPLSCKPAHFIAISKSRATRYQPANDYMVLLM